MRAKPVITTARPSLPSAIHADDADILAGRPLRSGTEQSMLSRFGDDVWDLSPAIFRANARPVTFRLNFGTTEDPALRRLAKEYVLARLLAPLRSYRAPCSPSTAIGTLLFLRHFGEFLRDRTGSVDMGRVDQRLLDAYLAHVQADPSRSSQQVRLYIDVPIDLHHFGPWVTGGGIPFLPWGGRTASNVSGRSRTSSENSTPRIPEPVIGALLHWSMRYVDVFAPDILAAREELDRLEARSAQIVAEDARQDRHERYRYRLRAWLEARRAEGRGVPLWERRPNTTRGIPDPTEGNAYNFRLMCLQIGCPQTGNLSSSTATVRMLDQMAGEMGTEVGGMDTPISLDPDTGLPWRERFDTDSLPHEERMLQAACYIVCAYLTGMRDSELQDMEPGCVSIERSADNLIERYRIRSTVYKHREATGVAADWITIAPVARAVEAMEVLSRRARGDRDLRSLWVSLKPWDWTADYLASQASLIIKMFRDGLDARVTNQPAIPHVDGHPWHFTTRQFRRTIAWYIANRPFGVIAGKIQYKHASVAMFEGYAGAPHGDFRRAVEQERVLGQLDDVVAYFEAYLQGDELGGPASSRLKQEFDHVWDTLGDLPGRVLDQKRLRTMLAHLGKTLHVGFLNDCFFDPASALCLRPDDKTVAPVISRCSPDRCPNSCLTTRHVAPWRASIEEGERLMQGNTLSAFQKVAITQDNDRKRRLIANLEDPMV
jgi:hypothetical protein